MEVGQHYQKACQPLSHGHQPPLEGNGKPPQYTHLHATISSELQRVDARNAISAAISASPPSIEELENILRQGIDADLSATELETLEAMLELELKRAAARSMINDVMHACLTTDGAPNSMVASTDGARTDGARVGSQQPSVNGTPVVARMTSAK